MKKMRGVTPEFIKEYMIRCFEPYYELYTDKQLKMMSSETNVTNWVKALTPYNKRYLEMAYDFWVQNNNRRPMLSDIKDLCDKYYWHERDMGLYDD